MRGKQLTPWISFGAVTVFMAVLLTYKWNSSDATAFLPGKTSHGHYQIELRCDVCHTPWNGVKEEACYKCHAEELKRANDSHPKSKFTDPRNADRLQAIDASNCVTCHREHVPEQTRAMGVTMPEDYCYHCHQETLKERPSHKDFPFNSCGTAGCHNYHDNTALYTDFLIKHLHEPDFAEPAQVVARAPAAADPAVRLGKERHDAPADKAGPQIVEEWAGSAHARAGVNCTGCHEPKSAKNWADAVGHATCGSCHQEEESGFLGGKHGMRLAQGLPPMEPFMARQPMKAAAAHRQLGCTSCHGSHGFETRRAAVEACLECHNDAHSLAYRDSPHFELWTRELAGRGEPGTGVSCATCHLPREEMSGESGTKVIVQHNQNDNLRPNEKMVRGVCLKCHGLGFSLNALADRGLIQKNFRGRPTVSLETLRLAEERSRERKKK